MNDRCRCPIKLRETGAMMGTLNEHRPQVKHCQTSGTKRRMVAQMQPAFRFPNEGKQNSPGLQQSEQLQNASSMRLRARRQLSPTNGRQLRSEDQKEKSKAKQERRRRRSKETRKEREKSSSAQLSSPHHPQGRKSNKAGADKRRRRRRSVAFERAWIEE